MKLEIEVKLEMKDMDRMNLSEEIKKALRGLNYKKLTKVQEEVIPLVLEGHDLVVKSKTGSGKTAAFGIPICEKIDWLINKPQVLILTPTRELCVQVKEDLTNIGRYKRIKVAAIYGRHSFQEQKMELKQKTHIIVGTPGRVKDHIEKGTMNLTSIKYLVIDEGDIMFNMGFLPQVEEIIRELKGDRTTLLFSATMQKEIKELASTYMKEAMDIEINDDESSEISIKQYQYKTEEYNKTSLLKDITKIWNPNSSIIFCKTKETVENLYKSLINEEYSCEKIHGDMEQTDRLKSMKRFKGGEVRYLIATDVVSRGIDVEEMDLVINYDCPRTKEEYVHRIGRTGRAASSGLAITFVTKFEEVRIGEIEEFLELKIDELEPPSKEMVEKAYPQFYKSQRDHTKLKVQKSEILNKDITKLHIRGGKDKKFRTVHFVAAICNIDGVTAEDIGIISIFEKHTYIEILNGKGKIVLENLSKASISGKKIKVSLAHK